MEKSSAILVLGASGLVGSAIVAKLKERGFVNVVGTYNKRKPSLEGLRYIQLDGTRQKDVEEVFATYRPEYVFLAAARVGGIEIAGYRGWDMSIL